MKPSTKKTIIGAIVGFMISGVSAAICKWRATDLIWAFWGASLCVSVIGTFVLVGLSFIEERRRKAEETNIVLGLLFGAGLVTVFVIFHHSYGMALIGWYPLGDNVATFFSVVRCVFARYWPVIISTMIAQFICFPRYGLLPAPKGTPELDDCNDPFLAPFRNLARLQVMTMLLMGFDKVANSAGSQAPNATEWAVIYIVLFILYFPFIPVGHKD
jgi:phosphate/sulfate permease